MHLKKLLCVSFAAFGLTGAFAVATASANITEAGSSLAYPLWSIWATHYSGISVSPGGSGLGISDIQHGSIDIGASDAPMTPSQYAGDTSGTPVQIPDLLSATGVGYNIRGVGFGLKLTGPILAQIYNGKITTWGNSSITKINKPFAAALRRAGKITPVFRSDGSGDSYAFEHFLAASAGRLWPAGYSTSWGGTAGIGENGNAGVAGEVHSNSGTLGYISAAYLIRQHISVAQIKNAAGKYEYPNAPNIAEAAKSNNRLSAQGPNFSGVSIVYPSSHYKTAYPVSTYSYAIVNKNNSQLAGVQALLTWAVSPTGGQRYGGQFDFLPLPAGIRAQADNLIAGL